MARSSEHPRPDAPIDVARLLAGGFISQVNYQPSVGSTNDRARELAPSIPREACLLVIADEQTAGRGRGGNRWWTGAGSLAFTLLLDPALRGIERRYSAMIALAAACAIVDAVEPVLAGQSVGLHWPNDVFVGDRKLAGILVEVLPDSRQVIGIGCNVNNTLASAPAEVAQLATTLHDATGEVHDRTQVLADILSHFAGSLAVLAKAPHELGRYANSRCLQCGRSLTLQTGTRIASGLCAGIADDGALLLDTSEGRQAFYSGVLVK
jgi:BirA family biotin operon repressor/biotin-[acetyl-CoA-carboxylase] ligase